MPLNTNLSLTADAWAKIVIEKWEDNILRLNIVDQSALLNSLSANIQREASGDPQLIQFAFNYYGKFLDMGVGNGVPVDKVGNGENRRKPRKWYSKTFFSQVKVLSTLLGEKYAMKGKFALVESIQDNPSNSSSF